MPIGKGARNSKLGKAIETDVATIKNTGESKAVNTEISKSVDTELQKEEAVSLTIKVPPSYRQHWQIEAKKRKTSVTQIITKALTEQLGLPDQ